MTAMPYSIRLNTSNQEIMLSGVVRPQMPAELAELVTGIEGFVANMQGTVFLNLKRLRHLNHTGFMTLARCLAQICRTRTELAIKVVITSVIPWARHKFALLARELPTLAVETYDDEFYPGQKLIEQSSLIPCLRTQTNILWNYERELLPRHGLTRGMQIADICCGIGDFAALVHREFAPSKIVAIDHSQLFLDYARGVAEQFGMSDIEYQRGDASSLLLDDNSFDFVTCRLALQIFDKPEDILSELFRIVKPTGRVYLTNEFMSHIFGYPRDASIRWTYRRSSEIFSRLGMDLDFGPKMRAYLTDCGFTDIKIDAIQVSNANANTDAEDFKRVVESWSDYIVGDLAPAAEADEETQRKLRRGFEDHMYAITHRRGFASWPVCVASGQKPKSP